MRPPNMTDEEVRELALRMKRETGKVPLQVLRQAARGGHQRISRILRELNGEPRESGPSASADGNGAADPSGGISQGVREAVDHLLTAIGRDMKQAAAESDARARAAEQALIARHQAEITEAAGQKSELEGYLDDLGVALAEAEDQRDAALEAAEGVQHRLTEVEALLDEERERWTEEQSRLEQELNAVQQAERRSSDALHAAEVAKTKAEATLRSTRESLEAMRKECRRSVDRCSALQASRDQLHHEASAARSKLSDLQRELDTERMTNRRWDQLLAKRLDEQAAAPKTGTRSNKPRSKKAVRAQGPEKPGS